MSATFIISKDIQTCDNCICERHESCCKKCYDRDFWQISEDFLIEIKNKFGYETKLLIEA